MLKAKLECRCSAALAVEAQPASNSTSELAQAGTSRIGQQKRPDRSDVESLEALWKPIPNDDSHAALERLQCAVAAQGTSTGLNGNFGVLRPLSSIHVLEQDRESSLLACRIKRCLSLVSVSAIAIFHSTHA